MSKKELDAGLRIGGKFFDYSTFNQLMLSFKESFSTESLAIEQANKDVEEVNKRFDNIKNQFSYDYYSLLDRRERHEINDKLRRFIVFNGKKMALLTEDFSPVHCSQKMINKLFNENFKYMYNDMHYVLEFDSNGEFLERETFRNISDFFVLLFEKNSVEKRAYNMQKDHLDAFDYAMKLDNIGIREIIDINEHVNHSDPNKEEGYKKTNNDIIGADFEVADKTRVPTLMQELVADYNNDFGMQILDPSEKGISTDESVERVFDIFKKEAIFHIKFERIHPFTDGNGRTGRIIMNKHLIEAGMAPVLITGVMRDEYKKYINDNNYEGLARMMLSSSSQLLSTWVSSRNIGVVGKKTDNSTLALFSIEDNNKIKNKIKSKILNNITLF